MMARLHTCGEYPAHWSRIAERAKRRVNWRCDRCDHPHAPRLGRTLTVHHFDGDKSNCAPWNLMPLCQACHLSVQARVDPSVPLMFDPNPWAMPYIAGLYESDPHAIPSPIYDLETWIAIYIKEVRPWPWWAPQPGALQHFDICPQ